MTTTMYHLNCQSDQLDFPRQVFICLVKFFLYAYDAWQVEHLYSFWLSVSGWHVFVCLVNPDLVEKVLLQPRHKLVSFLLTSETSAVASFLLLSRLPCAFFVWMLSPLLVFAVKLQSLQVFWSNCSGICCRFVGASAGVRPLDGVDGKDISMLFNSTSIEAMPNALRVCVERHPRYEQFNTLRDQNKTLTLLCTVVKHQPYTLLRIFLILVGMP